MFRTLMKSKLHRATVTDANLNYVGSITIDPDLIELADLMPNERVQIVNNNNGARLETYVIPGVPGSGDMCLNGAAARLVQPGDKIIVISYGMYDREEAAEHEPTVIILDDFNQPENSFGEEFLQPRPTEPGAEGRGSRGAFTGTEPAHSVLSDS